MCVIAKVESVGLLNAATAGSGSGSASGAALLVNTQLADHLKTKNTSQLINLITTVLWKLPR